MADVAEALVAQFDRMVRRDGGSLALVACDGDLITVAYRPGVDPTCDDGVCVLPDAELQQLMSETLRRRDPSLRVEVRRIDAPLPAGSPPDAG